ncbi:NADH-quinone oxidoreductase subunit K [Methanocella sp. MCL-LM]|uniref:NADH-quinone oxidoreductase subunit K n=1 Tax=Methanocella sp. MCL-LM TaxID=3412035 RepID=UPI003C77BDE0
MVDISIGNNIINGLAVIIFLTTFVIVAHTRLHPWVNTYAIQSLALGLLGAAVAYFTNSPHIYLVAALTIVIKAFVIPRFLEYTMNRINVNKEVEMMLNVPASLLVAGGLAIISYFITEPIIAHGSAITKNCLAISIAVVLIGFFIMISRRKAITQIMGLMVMENGLFLAAISTSYGMPLIVELGVFFDILVGVLIMGIFAFQINRTFDTVDTGILRRLRD